MTAEFVIELIIKGGPAVLSVVLLFLYLREAGKRDEAQTKYETLLKESEKEDKKLLERVLETLHSADATINANTTAIETNKGTLQTVMSFIHAVMREKPHE